MRTLLLTVVVALASALSRPAAAEPGGAKVFLTVDEALGLVYPECEIERTTTFLTKKQKKAAEKLAGHEIASKLVYTYTARKEGVLVGYAYFDTHEIRTKRETVMIALKPDQTVRRIEVLAFAEPIEYLPTGAWYGQFAGKRLDEDLELDRDIRGVMGATLTARATTRAVRTALSLHRVVHAETPG